MTQSEEATISFKCVYNNTDSDSDGKYFCIFFKSHYLNFSFT